LGAFHRQVEKLLAAGRLPVERVVVEASAFTQQKDVVGQLVDAGRELMLDTNAAELSAIGRYRGAAKSAPWACAEGPLRPEHFARGSNHDVIGKIARFAVEHGFHAVQAPTHLLEGSTDEWFGIDRQACEDLRRALDVACGAAIAIDFAEAAIKLTLADAATAEMLQRTNDRLARLGPVLRDLHATMADGSHAHSPARRGNRSATARSARQ
jgi:hypothetical protein